jgi:hypothetical protein
MPIHIGSHHKGISPGVKKPGIIKTPSPSGSQLIFPILILFLHMASSLTTAQPHALLDDVPLFASDEPLEMTIEADFRKLVETKDNEVPYYDSAKLTVTGKEGHTRIPIMVRARGYSRRLSLCDFPPLLLDFRKAGLQGTLFEGQNKLKLVTYCRDMDRYQEYVFHEYLIYKMFNILTDTSFRVRLTRIRYLDRGKDKAMAENYGFLIEDIDKLAERLGGEESDRLLHIHDLCDHTTLDRFTIFQYMISNVDWNIGQPMMHNVKLITIGSGQPIPIPYDFDFCGMINTSYAAAPPNLPIQSVRQRLFRGYCRHPGEYEKTMQGFLERRDEIYGLYKNFPYLNESVKKSAIKFLDQFYEVITNPKKTIKEFYNACPASHKHLHEM